MNRDRPFTILIAALGGEGGGVLSDWIVAAAMAAGLPVQSTSIPGVAQRTGATIYYVEIFPRPYDELGARRPVLGLYPVAGAIDAMIASEILEAGRALQNGFVTPETTLIAATHRVYATVEKMALGDGRFDAERVVRAAREIPRRAVLFDLTGDAEARLLPLNAVLLGALAASAGVPIPAECFERAIERKGVAVDGNLSGFRFGMKLASGAVTLAPPAPAAKRTTVLPELQAEAARILPAAAIAVAELGLERLVDYQDRDYARLYLDRLHRLAAVGSEALVAAAARHLALWMAYDDVIRVADLKSRPERYAKVRAEVRAKPDEPVAITEFFKPGVDEVASLLTPALGRRLTDWAEHRGLRDRLHLPLRLKSSTVLGYWRLRLLARLKGWRRHTWRFAEEQALIERWLAAMAAAASDPSLALEIAECARLLKGYGDTQRRGRTNFLKIMEQVVAPAVAGQRGPNAAETVRRARDAALADADGKKLSEAIAA